jgi:hypothetical protein
MVGPLREQRGRQRGDERRDAGNRCECLGRHDGGIMADQGASGMTSRSVSIASCAVSLAALIGMEPLQAHHAFAAEYDRDKPITLTGAMTKLEWTNPHARIYIDVKDDKGEVVNWDFELGPPNGLMRRGWNRNSLKAGHGRHD